MRIYEINWLAGLRLSIGLKELNRAPFGVDQSDFDIDLLDRIAVLWPVFRRRCCMTWVSRDDATTGSRVLAAFV
jgi:hypothetical protein